MSDMKDETRICVGVIAGAFGVRGEARIKSFCADPGAIADYAPLTNETGARSFTVRITRPVKGGFGARLGGVATREDAEALKGVRLYAPRDRLPALPDDEFYHSDLVGLSALDMGGAVLGEVIAVADYGGGDFLEVRLARNGKALLIPFTREAAPTVDLARGVVVVDPPEDVEEPDEETG